jgi:hypothetical protein
MVAVHLKLITEPKLTPSSTLKLSPHITFPYALKPLPNLA